MEKAKFRHIQIPWESHISAEVENTPTLVGATLKKVGIHSQPGDDVMKMHRLGPQR